MSTRVVGLIGGMSWQTTSLYYQIINQHITSKLGGIHSANLLIRSVDYADIARFTTTGNFDGMTEMLVSRGRELKAAGAQALALCANVAHKAATGLEREVGLPVLHIADFTALEVVRAGCRKVGLLGTRAVMEKDFYKARLREKHGLEVFVPSEEFSSKVDRLIFEDLSKETIASDVRKTFHDEYAHLVHDQLVDCVVLACTEFRLVYGEDDFTVPTFETTTLHAKGIAEWTLETGDSDRPGQQA
ncbi:hypothetical protein H2200_010022 [Cladophialophora chaetospira]|uniref:Aspartate racemase n=1 Tax=Cladophialophora chaetospira TaxID=386627 RepID=A0AA38X270_9EURO|nr:hypothetical protein H2200_010022 [Cladophialophora chaetospira]